MDKIIKCKICGKEFHPRTANATLCSPECRKVNHNRACVEAQRRRRKRQKEQIATGEAVPKLRKKAEVRRVKPVYKMRQCELCGKEFRPESPRQIYCSEKCKYPNRVIKEEPQKPMSSLAEINAKARALGMRYGEYVAKYGL